MELITTATLITVTTIFLTFLGMPDNGNGFAYNVEMDGQAVTSQIVYKKSESGKHLSHHRKYNYTYDEQGRLTQKEVLKWDEAFGTWRQNHCLSYVYDLSGYSIEYALWNRKEVGYTETIAKQTFDQSIAGTMAVALYKWNKSVNDWLIQENNVIMMTPDSRLLATLEWECAAE